MITTTIPTARYTGIVDWSAMMAESANRAGGVHAAFICPQGRHIKIVVATSGRFRVGNRVPVDSALTQCRSSRCSHPYFGEFDILAACMEPSHGKWDSFLYIPGRWLLPRPEDKKLIKIMQPVPTPVPLEPGAVWTADFNEAVKRLRGGKPRPQIRPEKEKNN